MSLPVIDQIVLPQFNMAIVSPVISDIHIIRQTVTLRNKF